MEASEEKGGAISGYFASRLRKPPSAADIGTDPVGLHYVFGSDLNKVDNLSFIADDMIIYVAGSVVVIENIETPYRQYLLPVDEMGVGFVAVHPQKHLFAVGGKGHMPNIYIYEYPSLKVI
jgi:hypothetical protein